MPTYTFQNTLTEEIWEEVLSMSERAAFLEKNQHIIQLITKAPVIGDPFNMGLTKQSTQMNQLLKRIKKDNYGSTINTGNITEL